MDDSRVPFLSPEAENEDSKSARKERNSKEDGNSPNNSYVDRFNLAYFIVFLQGVGMLLPWNFFITAANYFSDKFSNNLSIKNSFENVFSIASMIPAVIALFINVYFAHRINRHLRIVFCLFVTLSMFILTTVMVEIDTSSWTNQFFGLTVVAVVIINSFCAIYQGGMFGIAGLLGQRYTQAIMGGQGLGGTFAALANIFSLAFSNSTKDSAFVYFLAACIAITLCIVAYWFLFQLSFVKEILKTTTPPNRVDFDTYETERRPSASLNDIPHTQTTAEKSPPFLAVFKRILPMVISVLTTFLITLSLFPSITSKLTSVNSSNGSKWTNILFNPIVNFLFFNLSDLCGRTIAGWIQIFNYKSPWIPILSIARIIFIPLFLMCNYDRQNGYIPFVFNHDVYPVIIMILFGLSNGYLGSLGMMFGPKLVQPMHAETAANMMALSLSLGLALGAGFSFVIAQFI